MAQTANSLIAAPSMSESLRFGRPIARLVIENEVQLDATSLISSLEGYEADIVILRYPNRAANLFSHLMGLVSHEPLFADCLMYWECALPGTGSPLEVSDDLDVRLANVGELGELVRPVFAQYPNHYAANPLFESAAVLEGYVEWVTALVASEQAQCLVLTDRKGDRVGFAVVDLGVAVPDIRLAGIDPAHRGRGRYRELIAASMNLVLTKGYDRIAISTQAHNVAVMSTWARLGWTPMRVLTTVHMVRKGLLPQSDSARKVK